MQVVPDTLDPLLGFPDVRVVGDAFDPDLATIALCNRLAKAVWPLSLVQQRLFVLALATIRKGDTHPELLRIPQATYTCVFHLGKNHHAVARDLAKAVAGLNNARALIADSQGDKAVPLVAGAWYVPGAASNDGKPHVLLLLHAALTPYLYNLSGGFTKLPLSTLVGVSSKYTLPLLLLLRARTGGQNAFTTRLPLAALRRSLGVTGYKDRGDFAKRILEPARNELRLRNVVLRYRFHVSGPLTEVEFRGYFGDLGSFDSAEGPKARATRLAESLGFTGSLEPWAERHEWETVEAEVERVHAYVRSRPVGKRIAAPGGYLRTVLDKLDQAKTPTEVSAAANSPHESVSPPKNDKPNPQKATGDIPGMANNLLMRLNDERTDHLVKIFDALDPEAQQKFKDAAESALNLKVATKSRFQESVDPTLLINARALDLFEESNPVDYPVELRSVEAYVAARRPLDDLDPVRMNAVISEANKRFNGS